MAIKQLPFEKGEVLNIRQKGNRLIESEVLENLKKNLESEDILIVKCGKSFWDVSAYPEIFEAGSEFTVEDLTATDKKQMEKVEAPEPVFKAATTTENEMSMLFHRTDVTKENEELEKLERKTYYLRSKDVEALMLLHTHTRVEISALVREIFERGIRSIADEIEYGDIYAQAEKNIINGFTGKKKSFKKLTK